MPDQRITNLEEITTLDNGDWFELVDVSDETMASSGTNKKIKTNEFLNLSNLFDIDLESRSNGYGVIWTGSNYIYVPLARTDQSNTFTNKQTIDGNLEVQGGVAVSISTITSDYNITIDDYTILGDTSNEDTTLTLPSASTASRTIYNIKKIASPNILTIEGSGSETIDGDVSKAISDKFNSITVQSNGSEWFIL